MAHIVIRRPGQLPLSMALAGPLRIGRQEQNDLVLEDPHVSRNHAVLSPLPDEEQRWHIQDLGSRHGTRVNGQAITSARLSGGEHLQFGSVVVSFHVDDEATIVHQHNTAGGAPPRIDVDGDRRLQLIYDTSRAIGAMTDPDAMLERLLDAIIDVFGCERALAGLAEAGRGLVHRVVRIREGTRASEIVLSRAVVEATLERREALILRNAPGKNAPKTMVREHILSAMTVPLGLGAQPSGLLYVDDRSNLERFDSSDLEFLTALGHLVSAALESASRLQRAEAFVEASQDTAPWDIIGKSLPIVQMKQQIAKYAAALRANVLVRGESGVGKELVARAIHVSSPRSAAPFVTLNCAAIPETMIESELFGYEKGAFTGAVSKRRGKFALADGGTLFLDEIGDLALPAQAKLLRAIQEGEVQPLGSEKTTRVDVRIVSATHKDLAAEIKAGRFREDLYYRLNVVEIEVPPLRAREGDVALLAHTFASRAAKELNKPFDGITPLAIAALERHAWPGNIRELRNEMERAVIHADEPFIDAHDLSPKLGAARPKPGQPRGQSLAERFAELEPTERYLVSEALNQAQGNLTEAARILGITRIMIRRRVTRFGLGGTKAEPDADDD